MRVPLACAFLLGVAGGARTMLPAATVSRAVRRGTLCVKGTPLAFAEGLNLNRILVGLALAEMVADKLPMTPSRKATATFAARVLSGALAGAAVGVVARRRRWVRCLAVPARSSARRAARHSAGGWRLSSIGICRRQ